MARTEDFAIWADQQIKEGNGRRVAQALEAMNWSKIARTHATDYARIARRVGLNSIGLRILSRFVFDPGRERIVSQRPDELAEYGALLMKNGSISEALAVLRSIDPVIAPDTLLFQAFCHFSRWEYQEATMALRHYLKLNLAPYTRLVAQVNLASALVLTQEHDQAEIVIGETMDGAIKLNARRILGNCHEMRSQIHLDRSNLDLCERDLRAAREIFSDELSVDQIFLDKRLAIFQAMTTKSVEPLRTFRRSAVERRHWESVRDSDYCILRIQYDPSLLNHLYFGTPYSRYRERIESEFGDVDIAEHYIMGDSQGQIIDLSRPENRDLEAGSQIHRALCAFSQDFYKPLNYGALFANLFPDERFDPYSSPNRLRQVINRLRTWIADQKIPAQIEESHGYRLTVNRGVGFRLLQIQSPQDRISILWGKLKAGLSNADEVSARQVSSVLAIHPAAGKRLMRWAVEAKRAFKVGRGPSTRYKIAG